MSSKPSKKSSKKRKNAQTGGQAKTSKKKDGLSTPAKVLIVVFAALMVFSMMIPSLSAIVNSGSSTETMTADEMKEQINSTYEEQVAGYEEQLESDPDDEDALLSLGDNYLAWAVNLSYYASTDDETLQVYDHAEKAVEYYDRYLEDHADDSETRTSRAMAEYYGGDYASALADLEEITSDDPDYAAAWANLGLMYEISGDTDAAAEAYDTAIEKDPDDEAGVKSYAEGREEAMESGSSMTSTTGNLQQDLENATGVSAD